MIGNQVLNWLRDRVEPMRERGHGELVERWLFLEHAQESGSSEVYLQGLQELRLRAAAASEGDFEHFAAYLEGRVQAFALDRPERALDALVDLLGTLRRQGQRHSALGVATELELLRAYHKIDAPGFKDALLTGLEDLWGRLRGDTLPRLELLDVWWRTGYWSRDPEVMQRALHWAAEEPLALRGSWPYWEARRLWLGEEFDRAIELLRSLLDQMGPAGRADPLWRLYVEVELGLQLASADRTAESGPHLEEVARRARAHTDPMLHWNLARFRAAHHGAAGDPAAVVEAWTGGLAVLEDLGLDRLRCEFALSLGEAALEAGDPAARARARDVAGALWPRLRSRAELEDRWRALEREGPC